MTAITEEWLKEIGFKWFEVERSDRHWILWMGSAIAEGRKHRTSSHDDFGLELSKFHPDENVWGVFYRADYAGRYTRFIFCRDVWEQEQLIKLIEALTDFPFDAQNSMHGNYYRPEQARYYRKQDEQRLDRVIALNNRWRTDEPDETKAVRK